MPRASYDVEFDAEKEADRILRDVMHRARYTAGVRDALADVLERTITEAMESANVAVRFIKKKNSKRS